jgi:hypothetical protein
MSNEIAPAEPIGLTQAEKEALLSPRELREYQIYMRLRQPPMAQSTQLQFFQLFLNASSCEEIVRLNPGGFSLGAIVRARLENNWDELLAQHRAELMYKIKDRVQQVSLETVNRLCDELAASNKLNVDKVKKFLQTGDPEELKGTDVGSMKHMEKMIEGLAKLLGTDQPKKPGPTVNVNIGATGAIVDGKVLPSVPAGKPLPAQTAASALEIIHRSRQKQ